MSQADQSRRGLPDPGGPTVATVSDLLGIARTVAGHLSDAHSASVALKALEQAFALDPSDRTGEISALLGETYFIQQRYGDAVRHLEAAVAKRPDDVNLAHVFERAVRNCETRIELPMSVIEFTDAVKMTRPPALYLRAPEIKAPLPDALRRPWRSGPIVVGLQTIGGAAAGLVLDVLLTITRRVGLNDDTRPAWIRRPRYSVSSRLPRIANG